MGLTYIFVHGLSGWGSYDRIYRRMPYWGMRGGDLIAFLRSKGFDCHAASVSPTASAWDRACELYAQLTGTRTDYGKVHSARFGHARYGRDFSGQPLIPSFGPDTRLVLLGHSFGGATVRLFSELMTNGDADEREGTDAEDLSPIFLGGLEKRLHSIVTLASPMNGSTACDLFEDPSFNAAKVPVPGWSRVLARMMSLGTRPKMDGRDTRDYANHDLHIDSAMAMNRRITTLPSVYYFSVPCCATRKAADGTQKPKKEMEPLFVMRAHQLGCYTGKTRGGYVVDESWQPNDGLVNTVSAMIPTDAPGQPLDREKIRPGIWNVFPTVDGDHMFLQGGLMRRHDIRPFYLDLLNLIERTLPVD